MDVTVRSLTSSDADACDAIMRSLSDWFSYEPGLADCANAVRTQSGWVAARGTSVVGFATWVERTVASAEITWMAVQREHRNKGIGTAIIERLAVDLADRGYSLALAMTSAASKKPSGPDSYEDTRAFWHARGFLPLIELDIWETDIALLQVRPLTRPETPES
jgi:GNAT superfamily N-acetyltransferase